MPPKVLMVAADFPPQLGGVATYSQALARTLREAGIDLSVVTCVPGPRDRMPIARTSMFMNVKYLKIVPLAILTLVSSMKKRPDLLLLMKCNHEGIVGILVKMLLGIPYVVAAYGSEVLAFGESRLFGPFMRRLYRGAERVMVDSAFARGLVADCGVTADKIVVLHPGLDPVADVAPDPAEFAALRDRLGLGGKRILLTVSRIVKRKGHDRVAEALALLKDDNIVWVIAGDGPDRTYVEDLVWSLGLEDRVRMIGRRSSAEIDLLYRVADVFVMPSRREGIDVEGFGIAFVEAALRRLPVVAGRHGGVPEAVGDSGLLVDPHDSLDVARAIRALLDDPALAKRLGDSGRDRAVREFSREARTIEIRTLFAELTAAVDPSQVAARAGLGESTETLFGDSGRIGVAR
jgi:phosphatidyl-myo-inositol dimannoside synthase